MRQKIFAFTAVCLGFLFGTQNAAVGCSCTRLSKDQTIDISPTVFEGKVTSVRHVSLREDVPQITGKKTDQATTFTVVRKIKGAIPNEVEVFTILHEASCGYDFSRHLQETMIIATHTEYGGRLTTDYCLIMLLNARR